MTHYEIETWADDGVGGIWMPAVYGKNGQALKIVDEDEARLELADASKDGSKVRLVKVTRAVIQE